MTLIECFTASHIDNIAACLRLRPARMILVGRADQISDPLPRYKKLLRQRGLSTEISLCDVEKMDLAGIYAVFKTLIAEAGECVIDLTGGDENVIMAAGAALAGLDTAARQKIRVEKFDHDTNTVRDCLHDNRQLPSPEIRLTVEELIALHGGSIYPESYQPEAGSTRRDLAGLWTIVSDAPKDWNLAITRLGEFESRADSKMQVFLSLDRLRGSITNFDAKADTVRSLLNKLRRHGIIRDQSRQNILEYTYNSQLLRYCTLKAGNVLEVKTLLEARAVSENGAPYFNDGLMSVHIDWDGILHDPTDWVPDTRNEVDVVLMRGTTPLFISCKNGNVTEDELYKLHTVAQRFGGPYARKMLIASDLHPTSHRALVQRAWDMDIFPVADAAELSPTEWRQIFEKAMQ